MPDLKDVFRMATENVRPDPGALERQHRDQRWHVAKQRAGVYALVAGLVAATVFVGIRTLRQGTEESPTPGTAPSAPIGAAPTVEGLAGIWLVDDEDPLLGRFSADGTFAFDDMGALDTDPAAAGTYEVHGRIIRFMNGQSRVCPEGDRYAWRAGLTEAGRLHVFHEAVIDDVSDDCDLVGEQTWTRVSPSSPSGILITAARRSEEGAPPSTESALRGIWLLEGEGHLLRFGGDRTYAMDDTGRLGKEPDNAGTVTVDGRGGITLTSGANSRTCAEGDQWVWKEVRLAGDSLRGVVSETACPNDLGGELTWVRLSP